MVRLEHSYWLGLQRLAMPCFAPPTIFMIDPIMPDAGMGRLCGAIARIAIFGAPARTNSPDQPAGNALATATVPRHTFASFFAHGDQAVSEETS